MYDYVIFNQFHVHIINVLGLVCFKEYIKICGIKNTWILCYLTQYNFIVVFLIVIMHNLENSFVKIKNNFIYFIVIMEYQSNNFQCMLQ